MDYIEAFKNLNTNNKYSRKSPHKAILLLTVIEMYETNVWSENIIYYDDNLKNAFQRVWDRVLKEEDLFHPEMYLPFWFMQSEDFWHIVPKRGKEEIITILRDEHIKPSESKLIDCVKYAELDEDLFFMMTLPSGRSSLKRVLLETYFDLSEEQIDIMSKSDYNVIDHSVSALSDFEEMLKKGSNVETVEQAFPNSDLIRQFQKLNEDLQIVLNIEYYSFLKKHRIERDMFKEICPTVYDLYDHIVSHPLKQGDLLPSFGIVYMNFLSDLKIALLSEDCSMELIDEIEEAINLLTGNNSVVDAPVNDDTEHTLFAAKKEPVDINTTTSNNSSFDIVPAIITSINNGSDISIENSSVLCSILNKRGDRVFSDEGKLKYINGNLYRLKLSEDCFTIKGMRFIDNKWEKGNIKIVAYPRSDLYRTISKALDYCDIIENIVDSSVFRDCKLKVNGHWYFSNGTLISDGPARIKETGNQANQSIEQQRVTQNPLYESRKQALLKAMNYFKTPTEIKNICRTISRTAWGEAIKENDVEALISTLTEIECVEGKYILRKKRS